MDSEFWIQSLDLESGVLEFIWSSLLFWNSGAKSFYGNIFLELYPQGEDHRTEKEDKVTQEET